MNIVKEKLGFLNLEKEKKKVEEKSIKVEFDHPEWKDKEGKPDFSPLNAALRGMGIEI